MSDSLQAELDQIEAALQSLASLLAGEALAAAQKPLLEQKVALIQGGHNTVVGAGGVYAGGKVEGDIVTGVKIEETHYHIPDPRQDAIAQARRRYLERLQRYCQNLPLAALGGDEITDQEITLEQIYIDLDTTTKIPQEQNEMQDRLRMALELTHRRNVRPLSALEAVSQTSRIALLGEPGAGKSTFVRKLLAWQAAILLGNHAIQPLPGISSNLLPVLIVLRELAHHLNILDATSLNAEQYQAALANAVRNCIQTELQRREAGDFFDNLYQALCDGQCFLVFDGLDEVPQDQRQRVRQTVAAVIQEYAPKKMIVTCRVRSYVRGTILPGFEAHTLAPLNTEKITQFALGWYNAQKLLGRMDAFQVETQARSLAEAACSPEMRELASNPLMLTAMALIHQKEIVLPRESVRLYSLVVDVLLRRWQQRKVGIAELSPSPLLAAFLKDDLRLRSVMERLAYEAHRAGQSQHTTGELGRGLVLTLLETAEYLNNPGLAAEFLDYVDQRSGLLVGRGGETGYPSTYSFPHRTYQEYLAGCYLIGQRDLARAFLLCASEGDTWNWAVQLGIEELYYNRRGMNTLLDLAYNLCPQHQSADLRSQRAILWSGYIAALMGKETVIRDDGRLDGAAIYIERLVPQLVHLLESDLSAPERADAGRALARLGDPRRSVTRVSAMQFCWIPAGKFWMGNPASDGHSDEFPRHEVYLPDFWISSYPITNSQFAEFIQLGGYQQDSYWLEAREAGIWKGGRVLRRVFTQQGIEETWVGQPHDFGYPFNLSNHPVVGVTWYEAVAFCRWLNEKLIAERSADFWREGQVGWSELTGQKFLVTLPNEAEWEKAACGGSTGSGDENSVRTYPWGNAFDPDCANTRESGIGTTSAVGCFARGTGAFGQQEMSGNTWEWCRSLYRKKYPYPIKAELIALNSPNASATNPCVIRGGSFGNGASFAHCACRGRNYPDDWANLIGFRVVVLPATDVR